MRLLGIYNNRINQQPAVTQMLLVWNELFPADNFEFQEDILL